MCIRSSNSFLINLTEKRSVQAHCKAYHCKECGPIKATKLRRSIYQYLSTWKNICFWTITIKQHPKFTKETHMNYLRECWRRFITYMRRDVSLSVEQRNMKFIKVVEEHANGFIHYHLATDIYIHWSILNNIWQSIIERVTGVGGKNGNIHTKHIPDPRKMAGYITKYVVKMARDLAMKMRRFSKSNDIKLFPQKHSVSNWFYCNWKGQTIDEAINTFMASLNILVIDKHNFTKRDENLIYNIINSFEEMEWEYQITKKDFEAWHDKIYSEIEY